jgi:hypothetical protein
LCFRDQERLGHFDVEGIEQYSRTAALHLGATLLEKLLNVESEDRCARQMICAEGHHYEFVEERVKRVLTVVGPIELKRKYYYDAQCKTGRCPKDRTYDVEGTSFSPGVRRIMGRVGAYRAFGLGHEDIREMVGIEVTAKEIERISHKLGREVETFSREESAWEGTETRIETVYVCMDGTGVPMVRAETANRQGKGEDGQATTRETKLGCIFTQTRIDDQGYAVRDEHSTSYVGAIETADEFSERMYDEGLRRGVPQAKQVCVIGDGAAWIWTIAQEQFQGATEIIDLYHAREHYWKVANVFFAHRRGMLHRWTEKRRTELDAGDVPKVIKAILRLHPTTEEQREIVKAEVGYFQKHRERMRYDEFRRRGLFVGSGVLEAGCRTIIGQRLKQSGMHWTVAGANSIIALRCTLFSRRWEDFWTWRAKAA